MTNTFIHVDSANLFYRAKFTTQGEISEKLGMSLHIVFNAVRKAWADFKGTHVVFSFEGKSWRKEFYPPYKRNRKEKREALTPEQQAEDKLFWETFDMFEEFVRERTNCTTLQHMFLEADDLIAGFILSHPNDQHVIISTDGDYAQLIAENVRQYNGVTGVTTSLNGYFDSYGKRVIDKKTGEAKPAPDPEWLLFEKCMRGDTSDNVFSAYPGVRTKGSKNKVGLLEAFEDRHTQGWAWNNLQLQTWVDHAQETHTVLTDYTRNRVLCDLTAQPDHVQEYIAETIANEITNKKAVGQLGIKILQFCGKHELSSIADNITTYTTIFNARYPL